MTHKQIRFMARNINIQYSSTSNRAVSELGSANFERGTIEVNLTDDPAYNADTLLHEILHFVERDLRIIPCAHRDELQERVVALFATGLVSLMRQNPELFSEIQSMACCDREVLS